MPNVSRFRVLFIRSADAETVSGLRSLTPPGREQGEALRRKLGEHGISFGASIESGCPAVAQTMEIVLSGGPCVERYVMQPLHFGSDPAWKAALQPVFQALGAAPLKEYLRTPAAQVIHAFIDETAPLLHERLSTLRLPQPSSVAVCGYSLLLQAVAWGLGGKSPKDPVLQLTLDPGAYFTRAFSSLA